MSTRKYRVMRKGVEIYSLDAGSYLSKYRAGDIQPNDYYITDGLKGWDFASKCHLVTGGPAPSLPEPTRPAPQAFSRPAVQPTSFPRPNQSGLPGGGAVSYPPHSTPAYSPQPPQAGYSPQAPSAPAGRPGTPDRCPYCNAKTIRTARAIYLVGTRDSTGTGTSFGWGRRTRPRSWVSQRTSRSRLAQEMAPPGGGFPTSSLYILGLALLAIGTVFTIVIPALCIWGIYKINKSGMAEREKLELQRQVDEYERTWYCSKCATKFVW